jgi:hypothetical protein
MSRRAKVIRLPNSPPPDGASGLTEIYRCRGQAEALVVRGLMESEGIQIVLRSNLAQSVHPFSVGQQAEVILLARREDAARARAVLSRRQP